MADYWLDSNVFIEGKKGPYGFDIAPRFWKLIDEMSQAVRLMCPVSVYDELLKGQDDLVAWAMERRETGLFVEPNSVVQSTFSQIIAYVSANYPDTKATRRFLDGADPWVIAHAYVEGAKVVSLETREGRNSTVVKIPNVCGGFDPYRQVVVISTYQMLLELGESWGANG